MRELKDLGENPTDPKTHKHKHTESINTMAVHTIPLQSQTHFLKHKKNMEYILFVQVVKGEQYADCLNI